MPRLLWMSVGNQNLLTWDLNWCFIDIYPGEGNGTPLQYSCLENPMDGGAWWAAVHGVAKSRTWLSAFTFTFHFHVSEKEMSTQSSVLAWRIPGMAKPGGLPSMGSHRVRHDWSDLAANLPQLDIILYVCLFYFRLSFQSLSPTKIQTLWGRVPV